MTVFPTLPVVFPRSPMPTRRGALVLGAALVCALPVDAAEPSRATEPPTAATAPTAARPQEYAWSWGIGIAGASRQKPYRGFDRDNKVIPLLQFESRHVRLFGPGLEVRLPAIRLGATQRIDVGIVGRYDPAGGYELVDRVSDNRVVPGYAYRIR